MESPAESPFKKDEPVSGSRFWILLATIGAVIWLGFTVWHWGRRMEDELDFFVLAASVVMEVWLTVVLIRSLHGVSLCRSQRSFEIMAAAVRMQRQVWMILAVFAAAGTVSFAVFALYLRPHNDRLRTTIHEHPAPPPPVPGDTDNPTAPP